ncbi:hypothetical protein L1049_011803 [Liquidambar formosana]|uniref:Choline kinase 2 n=1 Tax=Liquidambar formosana TaxID=63359 RepID=A0AAP0X030_LIQFO
MVKLIYFFFLLSIFPDIRIPQFHIKNIDLLNKFSSPFVMGAVDNAIIYGDGRLPGEARNILQSLASNWGDVIDSKALQMIPLKGAMTNEVYQIKWPTKTEYVSRKVLVRIYGEGVEVFFDRDDEIRTFEFMSKHGQGPRLLGRFPNGRIEEFINARTLSASDLRDPDISALIAAKMKEFHDLDMPGPKNVILWDRLRKWLSAAKSLSSPEETKEFHLESLEEEISVLEKEICGDHQHIGFSHNDLQYGNIMMDEETRLITIIDYEYASYNPVAYDIANHFCEMAADYHTETPHILDYSKYPGLEERQRFLHIYLSTSGDQPSDVEMEQLIQDVEKYTLASHLLWGLWGIISEHVNEIDFDYMEYARQRFQQYWLTKPALLGSSGAPPPESVTDGKQEEDDIEKTSSKRPGLFKKLKKYFSLIKTTS